MSAELHIPKRVWAPAIILLLLAGVLSNLLLAEQPLAQTQTSYGAVPSAWGAAFDLLSELGLKPRRDRHKLSQRALSGAQWIIAPEWGDEQVELELEQIEGFVERGGNVLLIGADPRVWRGLGVTQQEPEAPDPKAKPAATRRQIAPSDSTQALRVESTLVSEGAALARRRAIELEPSSLFELPAADFEPVLRSDDRALALVRARGKGRLVLVSSRALLSNAQLDKAQNAALVVDLVRAYGAPVFDERCHGLGELPSAWAALGRGHSLCLALCFALLTAAALASARRWPLPEVREPAPPPPTLALFVGSLANLYQTRGRFQPDAVFRAYRAGFLRRFQRASFGHKEVSQQSLDAYLQREAARHGAEGRWLTGSATPTSTDQLLEAVAVLEAQAVRSRQP